MKIWIKLLAGSALGIILGLVSPQDGRLAEILPWLEQFALRLGRYALVPMLFFSLAIGVHKLREERRLFSTALRAALVSAAVSAAVIALGVTATMIVISSAPGRVPIVAEEQAQAVGFDLAGSALEMFPLNMFQALSSDGVFLLPIYAMAFFIGLGLSFDKAHGKQMAGLADSLSRLFYHISSFFVEILGFLMIALCAYWAIRFRNAASMAVFNWMMVSLGIIAAAIGLVALPFLLCLLRPKANPLSALYGSVAPAIAAFFSGDINFAMPALALHAKESFGAKRRSSALVLPMLAAFCRGGSAMVGASAFIVVFHSYSGMGMSVADATSLGLSALLLSFMLARHPGNGAYVALAALSLGFGRGYEEGYLILRPIAFYLVAVGAFLDAMIASLANYACARMGAFVEDRSPRQYV
ncbi:MAG: cation:dicarboxylase symporter family transporter [Treponema sp.]|nr:cation:dicarboxylase symporter family transporter [Treponema sp.]